MIDGLGVGDLTKEIEELEDSIMADRTSVMKIDAHLSSLV